MSDIPVVRAEAYYLPPLAMPADAWALVPPAERCARWCEVRMQRRIELPSATLLGQTTYARIDAGRWVAECPCGSAQIVSPADPRMACTECGAGWFPLTFPDDVAAAEASVMELLPAERFWWHPDDAAWNRPRQDLPPVEDPVEPAEPVQARPAPDPMRQAT